MFMVRRILEIVKIHWVFHEKKMVAENLASDTISRARSSSRPEDLSAVRSAAAGTRCAWGEVSGAVAASIAGIGSWPGPFVRGWLPSESCLLRAGVCRFCRSA